MKVLDNHQTGVIDKTIIKNLDQISIVFCDRCTSYVDIADLVEVHVTEKSTHQTTKTTLQWVHIAISNAKRLLSGIYRKIKGAYLKFSSERILLQPQPQILR
jgi:hypothetical protein